MKGFCSLGACGEAARDEKRDVADAGVRGDLNELFRLVGGEVARLLWKDVGVADGEDAETGDSSSVGLLILLLASSSIESIVTSRLAVVVFSASKGEENAGSISCNAETEELEEATEGLIENDGEKISSHSPT